MTISAMSNRSASVPGLLGTPTNNGTPNGTPNGGSKSRISFGKTPKADEPPLLKVEKEFQSAFDRLRERFPNISERRVYEALKEHDGHAGYAAKMLRDQDNGKIQDADPDDVEHVKTLLCSPIMFKHACDEKFKKYDKNGDGVLNWDEVVVLAGSLYNKFALERPPDSVLRAFFEATDENGDGVLSLTEFRQFFESFLRHAFFETGTLQNIVQKHREAETPRGWMMKDERIPCAAV